MNRAGKRPITQADLDALDRPIGTIDPPVSPSWLTIGAALKSRPLGESIGVTAVVALFLAFWAIFGGL